MKQGGGLLRRASVSEKGSLKEGQMGTRLKNSVLRRMKIYKVGELFFVFLELAVELNSLKSRGNIAFQSGWSLPCSIVLLRRLR